MNLKTIALTAVAALAIAGAAEAQTFQPKAAGHFMVNLRATDVAPVGKYDVTTLAGASTGLQAKASNDVKPTLGITYFITDNIAVEAIAGSTHHTVSAVGPGVDLKVKETWVLPPVVSLQYHFMPKERFSPYVGAGVNYMVFYSGKNLNGFNLKIKDGFGASLQVGADYAISGPWSANIDVKKIFFDTDAHDYTTGIKTKVKLNPWVASVGVGYRF